MLISTIQHSSVGEKETDGIADILGDSEGLWLGALVVVGTKDKDGDRLGLGVTSRQWKKPAPLIYCKRYKDVLCQIPTHQSTSSSTDTDQLTHNS